jgi:hypothetical protein
MQQKQQQPSDMVFDPNQQAPVSTALDVEYPVNFDEFLPIWDFFGNSEALDWVSLSAGYSCTGKKNARYLIETLAC